MDASLHVLLGQVPADACLEGGDDDAQLLVTQVLQAGQDAGLEKHLGVAQLELLVLEVVLAAEAVGDGLGGGLLVRDFCLNLSKFL